MTGGGGGGREELARRVLRRVRRALGGGPRVYTSYGEVERAEYAFYIRYLRPGMTVFDVGANVGELAILFSRFVGPEGRVYAFEPGPATFEKLRAVLEAMAARNVVAENAAVADGEGTRAFHVYDEAHSELNSLGRRPLEKYGLNLTSTTEEVRALTIDAYCEREGIGSIDLLKVDVEGAELQVLRGAHRMLQERRVRRLLFEFGQTTFDMGNSPREIEGFLRGVGYRVRNLVRGDPPFPGGERVETAQFAMHVAVPG